MSKREKAVAQGWRRIDEAPGSAAPQGLQFA
jgi:hypothetical protein